MIVLGKRLIISYFMILPLLGFGQKYIDRYNLDFEAPLISNKSSWIFIPDDFRIELDSIEKVHGERSFLLSRMYLNREFTSCLYQTILLAKPGKRIEVSIQTKTLLLQATWLKINVFDKNRNFIKSDSLSIKSDDIWKKNYIIVNSETEFLMIDIEVWAKESFKDKKKKVKLWLDDMRIVINNIDLLQYNDCKFSFSDSEIDEIKNHDTLTSELSISKNDLNKIGKRKIFGFGETTHGSKEIEKSIFENIKQLISEKNCKLVLLEVPIDIGIRLNQYVNEGLKDENVREIVNGITYDIDLFNSFLDWIKSYNVSAKEKVVLFGIDRYVGGSPRHINNYLLSKKFSSNTLDSLLTLINSNNYGSIPLKFALSNSNELSILLKKQNYESIIQYLKNRTDSIYTIIVPFKQSGDWNEAYRDYLLWQNAKFAIENFSSKSSTTAIIAHISHLNKMVPIFLTTVKSLGQYLSESFGEEFYLIGMLFGEGTISVRSILTSKICVQKIDNPIQNCIEYLCSLSKESNFFKTIPLSTTSPVLMRKIGAFYLENQQFAPSFVSGSMNAFIFIGQSSNSRVYQSINTTGYKIHDLYQHKQY